jgi:hypothetical protein
MVAHDCIRTCNKIFNDSDLLFVGYLARILPRILHHVRKWGLIYVRFQGGKYSTVPLIRVSLIKLFQMRKTVRNYFLANAETKFFYDGVTFVVTRILMAYMVFTFVLLEFWPCIRLYM